MSWVDFLSFCQGLLRSMGSFVSQVIGFLSYSFDVPGFGVYQVYECLFGLAVGSFLIILVVKFIIGVFT